MKKIQILGSGCSKCNDLTANTLKAIGNSPDYQVEKVLDITKIMEMGVMVTPALVVDGVVISSGKVLSPQEIKEHLKIKDTDDDESDTNCRPGFGDCDCGGCC